MDTGAVTRFLRRTFFVPKEREGAVVRLEVWHLGSSRRAGAPTFDANFVPNQKIDESTIDRIVDDIDKVTQDEADQLDGVQQYVILVHRENTGDRPTGRFPFRQTGEADEGGDTANPQSEPPNLAGIAAQQMRHNEALVRTTVGGWREVIAVMQKTIARQQDQIEELIKDRMQGMQEIEAAQSNRDQREAERLERQAREKRQDALIETFLPLVPAVVNMMSGKKLLPERTTPERLMVMKFMETVTPEQFTKLREILEPEQYGIIAMMLNDIHEGIDANLPNLFKRFLSVLPEQTAQQVRDVFNLAQNAAVRTMIESFDRAEQRRLAEQAQSAAQPEPAHAPR